MPRAASGKRAHAELKPVVQEAPVAIPERTVEEQEPPLLAYDEGRLDLVLLPVIFSRKEHGSRDGTAT